MKKLLFIILISAPLFAQTFVVEKINGNVRVLRGISENWQPVNQGDILSGDDLISTDENSFIQLKNEKSKFLLRSNATLGLDKIKEISINDLLLALALEEIRSIPEGKGSKNVTNTAVYGTKIPSASRQIPADNFGIKKLNGAKQLAENGFSESAVIVAKETYRNYPSTRKMISERLFFVDVLLNLNLWQEAASELEDIRKNDRDNKYSTEFNSRMEKIRANMTE